MSNELACRHSRIGRPIPPQYFLSHSDKLSRISLFPSPLQELLMVESTNLCEVIDTEVALETLPEQRRLTPAIGRIGLPD